MLWKVWVQTEPAPTAWIRSASIRWQQKAWQQTRYGREIDHADANYRNNNNNDDDDDDDDDTKRWC